LQVAARPEAAIVQTVALAETAAPLDGELRVITDPPTVQISPTPRTKNEIKALIALVNHGNVERGFYAAEKEAAKIAATADSWLTRFLRSHFGTAKVQTDVVGNIGIVSLHLSKPPGREVVVSLGSRVGFGLRGGDDKSFSVAEGTRFIFNDQNWSQPAMSVIQLDPKLKTTADASMEIRSGNIPLSWSITFTLLAGMFMTFGVYHKFILPYPVIDKPGTGHSLGGFMKEFLHTFSAFFKKEKIGYLLLFLLFFRFAEAQLVKMVAPFLLDAREKGGLGLTTSQVGVAYGTVGIAALTCGGLLGGMVAAKKGLKFWLWWMVLAIHLPDAVFVYLAYTLPDNFWIINTCVAIEQFGYGFGFTAYMLYMIYIARGRHQTAHYAICTGFMALGMMIPGMFSGWLQDIIGYQHFFIWVLLATIPGFLVVTLIPLDPEFGKKTND
jgi:PAT family beta-lactamase induction signal transducer AmpG